MDNNKNYYVDDNNKNYYVDDSNYVGNHLFNYLRDYTCDNPNSFFIYGPYVKPTNSNYITIICKNNEIIIKDKHIYFPTPYGQYYTFYDNTQLSYHSNNNTKDTCYILDICEHVLELILNKEPTELKIEKQTFLRTDRDRINRNTVFKVIRGGFSDNLRCYAWAVEHNVISLIHPAPKLGIFRNENHDNRNLLKTNLKNIVTIRNVRNLKLAWPLQSYNQNILKNEISKLKSIYKYKDITIKLINKFKNEYLLIGLRMNYSMRGRTITSLANVINKIADAIKRNDIIILVIDNKKFYKFFIYAFYDVLIHKKVYLLNVESNDVLDMLEIGRYSKEFIHTLSGFYNIMEMYHI